MRATFEPWRPAAEFPVPDAGEETVRLGALEEEWRGWLRSHRSSDVDGADGAPPARRKEDVKRSRVTSLPIVLSAA